MLSKYYKQPIALSFRRMITSLLDSTILFLVSFGFVALTCSTVIPAIPSFKEEYDKMETYRLNCLKMGEESGLVVYKEKEGDAKYDPENAVDIVTMFNHYLESHILLAYNHNPEAFDGLDLTPLKNYKSGVAGFDNDIFSSFYTRYVPKYNNFGGKQNDILSFKVEGYEKELTPKAYLHYIIKKYTPIETDHLEYYPWKNAGGYEDEDYLELKTEYAKNLYIYFSLKKDSGTVAYYNMLQVMYDNLYKDSTNTFTSSGRYSASLSNYVDSYRSCSIFNVVGVVISYIVSLILCICLPIFIDKKGRTIGNFAFKNCPITSDGEDLELKHKIIRSICFLFTGVGALIPSTYFAGVLNGSGMYPLFSIGSLNVSLFHFMILFFVIAIVSLIVMALDRMHRSFVELISNTIVVDIREYDPTIVVEDSSNIETSSAKEIIEVNDYFDSSCFDNSERNNEINKNSKDHNEDENKN